MYGRQQLPSELNRQNSVLLDLQDLLAEIVDGPRGNLRQRRRTVRQQGDGVDDLGVSLGVYSLHDLFCLELDDYLQMMSLVRILLVQPVH